MRFYFDCIVISDRYGKHIFGRNMRIKVQRVFSEKENYMEVPTYALSKSKLHYYLLISIIILEKEI